MKISEILKMPPIKKEDGFDLFVQILKEYVSGKDLENLLMLKALMVYKFLEKMTNEKIEDEFLGVINLKEHKYMDEFYDGGKYGARLSCLMCENKPVFLVSVHGKYMEDYDIFLLNAEIFESVLNVMIDKLNIKEEKVKEFSIEEDIKNIEVAGNINLFDVYDPSFIPKYKEGDLVWAFVKEDPNSYEDKNVLTKIKIEEVTPYHKIFCYKGLQIERGLIKDAKCWEVVFRENGENIRPMYCETHDDLVLGKVEDINMPDFALNNCKEGDKENFVFNIKTCFEFANLFKNNKKSNYKF